MKNIHRPFRIESEEPLAGGLRFNFGCRYINMTVIIDGVKADVRFESEKELGEVVGEIEKWADESGFCLSGVRVDGSRAEDLDALFERNIRDVKTLELDTVPLAVLNAEALAMLEEALFSWKDCGDKNAVETQWRESPGAAFIARNNRPLAKLLYGGFSDETVAKALVMIKERRQETEEPQKMFLEMEDSLNGYFVRLSDLPLDLQTGNDRQAAETIEGFASFVQKLFRLYPLFRYAISKPDNETISKLILDLQSALKEFLAAYENKDMVLCGDLAEYEIAPRTKHLYTALKEKLQLSDETKKVG
jgi:hypothetical protein